MNTYTNIKLEGARESAYLRQVNCQRRLLLGKFLGVKTELSLGTRVSNLKSVALTIFELLAFNSHDWPLRTDTQTDRHTSNERIISAIHFVHLAENIGR